jgi:hypothetical protein
MSKLKPIGSEKLSGEDKFKRIMEIARFNETIPNVVNETSRSEYSISLADGNNYQIVKERQGYIIKKTISESETEYIEPMKNRKYYTSYSQALKRLNLVAGELNRVNENEEGVSFFGEQKKFVLKTPKSAEPTPEPAPAPAPPSEPPAVPSPELPPSPVGDEAPVEDDLGADMGAEDLGGKDNDMDMGGETDEEKVTFKTIQKLTGKLTQKIRTLDNEEGMTSEDIKYVINMVLSSLDLGNLSEEDKEDITSKFEESEESFEGGDEFGGEEMGSEESDYDGVPADTEEPEAEVGEGSHYGSFGNQNKWYDEDDNQFDDEFDFDYDEEEFDEFDPYIEKHGKNANWFSNKELDKDFERRRFNKNKEEFGPFKVRSRKDKAEVGEGSHYGSFGNQNKWYDEDDNQFDDEFDFDYDEEEFDEFDPYIEKHGKNANWFSNKELDKDFERRRFNKNKEEFGPFKVRSRKDKESGHGAIFDSIFGESKVDKVISKYFEVTKKEILENKQKKEGRKVEQLSEVKKEMKNVIKLTQTIEQELASKKFLEENKGYVFVGKTNKNNLVFENKNKQIKISPEGLVL